MSGAPSVDDLRLVRAVVECGSVGGAARSLGRSRPTPARSELHRQAGHILAHLDRVYESAVAASSLDPLRVGTFASVCPRIVTGLEELLDAPFTTLVDHGPQLVDLVAESSIDVAGPTGGAWPVTPARSPCRLLDL